MKVFPLSINREGHHVVVATCVDASDLHVALEIIIQRFDVPLQHAVDLALAHADRKGMVAVNGILELEFLIVERVAVLDCRLEASHCWRHKHERDRCRRKGDQEGFGRCDERVGDDRAGRFPGLAHGWIFRGGWRSDRVQIELGSALEAENAAELIVLSAVRTCDHRLAPGVSMTGHAIIDPSWSSICPIWRVSEPHPFSWANWLQSPFSPLTCNCHSGNP